MAKPSITNRKDDHVDIVLGGGVGFRTVTTGLERYQFVHCALPELRLDDINLAAALFGRTLQAPLLISSMTGGPVRAESINRHLAEAAQELGIAFAVGSQRVALDGESSGGLARTLREATPDIPLIGNIGGAQIIGPQGVERARRALDMIEADGLFVHLNPLQEAVQDLGDTDWRGVLDGIAALTKAGLPIAVKEVGFGLSGPVAQQLNEIGVSVIDSAGAGGTNWAMVEGERGEAPHLQHIARAFSDWGLPTADSIIAARRAAPTATIIGSGGIVTGIDAAMAIRLGADIVGQAAATLDAASQSTEAVIEHFQRVIETLRIVCFCTGSGDLRALRHAALSRRAIPSEFSDGELPQLSR